MSNPILAVVRTLAGTCLVMFAYVIRAAPAEPVCFSPSALAASPDGKSLFVACATADHLAVVDLASNQIARRLSLPGSPSGLAVSRSGTRLYVSCSAPESQISVIDPERGGILDQIPVGHTAMSPILSPDERRLYVCNRFNHDISVIDLTAGAVIKRIRVSREPVAAALTPDGRFLLVANHLYDGMGNPKNAKSLLWTHRTPPAMSLGVRKSAEVAVRAGIRHILFTTQPDDVPAAIDDYLKSLQPVPSPYLVNGALSEAADRGRRIFNDPQTGCADCHSPPLFTDLAAVDVGTRGRYDRPEDPDPFDTPTLVELWRTAPYLHDGSAATIRELLVRLNPHDRHGTTSHLTSQQLDDLEAYLLSL